MRAVWTHVQIYLAGPVPLLDHFLQAPLSGGGEVFVSSLMLYATAMFLIFIDFERSCFFTYWLGFGVLVYLAGFMILRTFLLKTGWMRVVPLKTQGGLRP